MIFGKYIDTAGRLGIEVRAMTEVVRNGFRRSVPAASAVCRAELAGLREQIDAAYARQHAYIQQVGNWFTGLPRLYREAGLAYYSLWRLRCLFAKEDCEQDRQRHLERVLAFIAA